MISNEQYQRFIKTSVDNVLDRDGHTRFDYKTLKIAYIAVTRAEYGDVPSSVMGLFRNIINFLHLEPSDREQVTLMLALINVHMAHLLISLPKEDLFNQVLESSVK